MHMSTPVLRTQLLFTHKDDPYSVSAKVVFLLTSYNKLRLQLQWQKCDKTSSTVSNIVGCIGERMVSLEKAPQEVIIISFFTRV